VIPIAIYDGNSVLTIYCITAMNLCTLSWQAKLMHVQGEK